MSEEYTGGRSGMGVHAACCTVVALVVFQPFMPERYWSIGSLANIEERSVAPVTLRFVPTKVCRWL